MLDLGTGIESMHDLSRRNISLGQSAPYDGLEKHKHSVIIMIFESLCKNIDRLLISN